MCILGYRPFSSWCSNFYSFSPFLSLLEINLDTLTQVLQILLKAKLLTCEDDDEHLTVNSVVDLYAGFKK
jgi:hypothetical protein